MKHFNFAVGALVKCLQIFLTCKSLSTLIFLANHQVLLLFFFVFSKKFNSIKTHIIVEFLSLTVIQLLLSLHFLYQVLEDRLDTRCLFFAVYHVYASFTKHLVNLSSNNGFNC